MSQAPVSGYATTMQYGWETTFGSASGTYNKAFGQGQKITTFDIDNTNEPVFQIGSRDAQRQYVKDFKGSFGIEFLLSDPWFMRSVLGAAPTTAGAGPYTHTWTVANGGIANTLSSMTINAATDLDTDSDKLLLGCAVDTCSISAAVDEAVKVRLDGKYANSTKDTSLTTAVNPVEEALYFQQASLEFPTSTTLADVQSYEMNFGNNIDMIYGLGSRFAQKVVARQRDWTMKVSMTYEADADLLDKVLGSSTAATATVPEIATMKFTATNGLSTTNTRSYVFTFANVMVEKTSMPITLEDTTKIDATLRARTLTSLVVTNNTSAAL